MTNKKRWPRLRKKTPINTEPVNSEVLDQIKRAKELQREANKRMNEWSKGNEGFNVEPFIDRWVKLRGEYKNKFIELVVDHMSAADAISEVNETLRYGFKMEEAAIDPGEVDTLIGKLFRIRATSLLLEKAKISVEYRKDIIKRAIAREFPTRDGAVAKADRSPVQVNVPRTPMPRVKPEPPQKPSKIRNVRQPEEFS